MGFSPWPPIAHLEKDQLSSVLIDPKDADAVQLGQFGNQDAHQGDCVDDEVYLVVLCVEAGKEIKYNWRNCQELPGSSELHTIVHLLPVSEQPGLPLIWGLKGRSFHSV